MFLKIISVEVRVLCKYFQNDKRSRIYLCKFIFHNKTQIPFLWIFKLSMWNWNITFYTMNAEDNVAENLTLAVFAFRCVGAFRVPRKCQRIFTNDLCREKRERLHFLDIFLSVVRLLLSQRWGGGAGTGKTVFLY